MMTDSCYICHNPARHLTPTIINNKEEVSLICELCISKQGPGIRIKEIGTRGWYHPNGIEFVAVNGRRK